MGCTAQCFQEDARRAGRYVTQRTEGSYHVGGSHRRRSGRSCTPSEALPWSISLAAFPLIFPSWSGEYPFTLLCNYHDPRLLFDLPIRPYVTSSVSFESFLAFCTYAFIAEAGHCTCTRCAVILDSEDGVGIPNFTFSTDFLVNAIISLNHPRRFICASSSEKIRLPCCSVAVVGGFPHNGPVLWFGVWARLWLQSHSLAEIFHQVKISFMSQGFT